jgi:F-type H+-transporting ATPase subunit alpha
VSRVGGDAQIKAMKKVAGGLKLALSQYRDLEAFAAFSSDLDPVSRAQLDRGARLVELLKQPQYSPLPVERQVVSVWAGTGGYLDDVPIGDVRRFEDEFLDDLQRSHEGVYASIRETGELNDDTATVLKDAIEEFRRGFEVSGGGTLGSDDDERDGEGGRDREGHSASDREDDSDSQGDSDSASEDDRDRGQARDVGGDGDEPAEPMDEDRVERETVTRRTPPPPRALD